MFYRQAGVFHSRYPQTRALFPVRADRIALAILLLAALAAPLFSASGTISAVLTPWLIWTSAVLGLNLILGWAGQFHFGYGAVMGIGAYAAIHAERVGAPWELALVLGGVCATLCGCLFAFAALRVKGLYLALSTLAMQFAMDWVLSHVPAITGGSQATLQAPQVRLLGVPVTGDTGSYYIALVWCLLVTVFMLNLKRSPLGRALVAVREKDYAAAVIGVDSFRYKLVAFAMSSFIGGVSGALIVFVFYGAATPEQFSMDVSIVLLAMVIIGGLGSVIGSYMGAAFILLVPGRLNALVGWLSERASTGLSPEVLAHIPHLFYGALIIGFLLLEPLGLGKMYQNVRNYLMVWPYGHLRK